MREVAKLAYGYKAFKITRPFIVTAPSPTVVFRPEPTGIGSSSFLQESKRHVFVISITCIFVLLCFFPSA